MSSADMSAEERESRRFSLTNLALAFGAATISVTALLSEQQHARAERTLQIKTDALATFAKGHAEMKTALASIKNELPFDIEERSVVNGLSIEDFATLRPVLAPVVAARNAHTAAYFSSMPSWSAKEREFLVHEVNAANAIADCYEQGALKVLNEAEAAQVKANLNAKCRDLGHQWLIFENDGQSVQAIMVQQIYGAEENLGVDPEMMFNLPVNHAADETSTNSAG